MAARRQPQPIPAYLSRTNDHLALTAYIPWRALQATLLIITSPPFSPPSQEVQRVMSQCIDDINSNIDSIRSPARGPASNYTLPAEDLVGSVELKLSNDVQVAGVACDIDSAGYAAMERAFIKVTGKCEPYSVTGKCLQHVAGEGSLIVIGLEFHLGIPGNCDLHAQES